MKIIATAIHRNWKHQRKLCWQTLLSNLAIKKALTEQSKLKQERLIASPMQFALPASYKNAKPKNLLKGLACVRTMCWNKICCINTCQRVQHSFIIIHQVTCFAKYTQGCSGFQFGQHGVASSISCTSYMGTGTQRKHTQLCQSLRVLPLGDLNCPNCCRQISRKVRLVLQTKPQLDYPLQHCNFQISLI